MTGGSGFIGSHLVDLLASEDHEVRIVDDLSGGHLSNLNNQRDNPKVSLYEQNINLLEANEKVFHKADFCFHLAGIGDIVPSVIKPVEYMETNVQGTVKVLEASRHFGVKKFIYAASSSCYGLAQAPTDENHPINPQYPYALSKYLGEQAAFHWGKVYGIPTNSICIFNAYGERVRTTGAYGAVFGVFLKQKLSDKPLTVVGDGTQLRDFIYVTDVAKAFLSAAETGSMGQRYNIGSGEPKSINYLVQLLGAKEIVYVPKRPAEPQVTHANIGKALHSLGWLPKVHFEVGVNMMINAIEYWSDAPLWDEFSIANATQKWFEVFKED
ncbi:NAD-dependent epimerase/dehydratase family protein [Paracoccaceae bacterium]|nr:NAD-dependent epimerase/dehydratase family protein [Paracoccaceae bacterium]